MADCTGFGSMPFVPNENKVDAATKKQQKDAALIHRYEKIKDQLRKLQMEMFDRGLIDDDQIMDDEEEFEIGGAL